MFNGEHMKKKRILIKDCKPAMIIAESIHNDMGTMIVAVNTVLNEYILNKMEKLGIESVYVLEEEEVLNETQIKKRILTSKYNTSVEYMRDVLFDISAGKEVELKHINTITNDFISDNFEKVQIVDCLDEIRSVDDYTYYHSVNVSMICVLIGKWLKVKKWVLKELALAGMLHDIGKARIDKSILNKPEPLSYEENIEIKKHSLLGYRIIENRRQISRDVKMAVLMHHERLDGSGYPLCAKGESLPLYARILAIADVFDAMTSNRVYRGKVSPFDVFSMLEKEIFGKLDTAIIKVFLENLSPYYIGRKISVSNGEIGEIVYINPFIHSKPVIRINDMYYDLNERSDLKIISII